MARAIFRAYSNSAINDCERQLDRFANFNIDVAGKFFRLAVPRGPRELRNTNGLARGLGEDCPIDLQGVSGRTPKPSGTGDGSEAWPVMGHAYFGLRASVRRDRLQRLEVHDE